MTNDKNCDVQPAPRKSIAKDVHVCQNCKTHKNNPSRCTLKQAFTPRKGTCTQWSLKR